MHLLHALLQFGVLLFEGVNVGGHALQGCGERQGGVGGTAVSTRTGVQKRIRSPVAPDRRRANAPRLVDCSATAP